MNNRYQKIVTLMIIVSIAITTVIHTTVYAAGNKSSSQVITEVKRGNTMGNLNNGGRVIEKNGKYYLYYQGNTRQEASGMDPEGITQEETKTLRKEIYPNGTWLGYYWVVEPGIFAVKKDGSAKPLRITNRFQEKPKLYDACFMNMYGTNLYYVSTNKQDGHPNVICKLSLDGDSKSRQLFTCKDSRKEIKNMAVMNDWIYYALTVGGMETSIYRMRLDGTDKTLLADTTSKYFDIDGTWLYCFKDYTSIKRIKLTDPDQEQTVVTTHTVVEDINCYKGKVYFTNYPEEVGVIPAKAGNTKQNIKILAKGKLISVENDKIYYFRGGEIKDKLYHTNMNGKGEKYIGEFDTGSAQIINGNIIVGSNLESSNLKAFESLRYEKD